MLMKNVSGKTLNRKLPCGEWVTVEVDETYDFPEGPGFEDDPRLEAVKKVKSEISLDLNNDGVVDKKDRSIAARVMGSVRKGRKKSTKKRKK